MEIKIQVLSTEIETVPTQKGSYQKLSVAYKDLSNAGKVASKILMSFTNKTVFETMALAKPTEVYDVEMVKGEKYWDWTKVSKGTNAVGATGGVSKQEHSAGNTNVGTATKGGWETPAERAAKQIYIVRQSSVSSAVAALTSTGKVVPSVEDVIKYAREIEAYVFETERESKEVVKKDVGSIEDISEDIPF